MPCGVIHPIQIERSTIRISATDSAMRRVSAFTVRIALSVLLFILLFVAWKGGLIQPHGFAP